MPLCCSRASLRKTFLVTGCVLFGFFLGSEMSSIGKVTDAFARYLNDATTQHADGRLTARGGGGPAPHAQHAVGTNRSNATSFLGGYRSPVETMFGHYSNKAVERETQRHDRWVVDSIAYLHTFGDAEKYEEYRGGSQPKPITIIILTVNRAVPYLAVNLATLLRGHTPDVFMERLNVHVANIEKRPGRTTYHLLESLKAKLPFIAFHSWTDKSPEHANIRSRQKLFLEQQKLDYARALRLCREAASKWCVIMEDDAVPCVNFALKFDKYVNKDRFMNASIAGTHHYDVDRVAMVKLYVPHNDGAAGKERLVYSDEYAESLYDAERAVDLTEAYSRGIPVDKVEYRIRFSNKMYGVVANAYPRAVLDRIIQFLDETGRTLKQPTDIALTYSFVVANKLALLQTNPSLVNHIGYHSENKDGGRTFGGISTDVRFQLDDGPDDVDSTRRNAAVPRTNDIPMKVRGSVKGDKPNAIHQVVIETQGSA